MNFDLRHLRYFVTLAEEQNFARAAERLHMTQPPLSQQIMQLEETLGVPLFVRGKRPLRLTAAGSELLPEARRLLSGAEAFR
jgi:DNA-binding transcriptional LysR family regulator